MLLNEFLSLVADDGLSKMFHAEAALVNAAHAAIVLGDSRLSLLKDAADKHLQPRINRLTDERLRTAYLKKYTIRGLLNLIAQGKASDQ